MVRGARALHLSPNHAGARRQSRQQLGAHNHLGFVLGERPEAGRGANALRLDRAPLGGDHSEPSDLAADDVDAEVAGVHPR